MRHRGLQGKRAAQCCNQVFHATHTPHKVAVTASQMGYASKIDSWWQCEEAGSTSKQRPPSNRAIAGLMIDTEACTDVSHAPLKQSRLQSLQCSMVLQSLQYCRETAVQRAAVATNRGPHWRYKQGAALTHPRQTHNQSHMRLNMFPLYRGHHHNQCSLLQQ